MSLFDIFKKKKKIKRFNSIELNLLKYLDGLEVENPNIAEYWTYEYNINREKLVKQFIAQGLMILDDKKDFDKLKVAELKQILADKRLIKTGKKADLINRIKENLTDEELSQYLKSNKKYYKLTDKGKEAIRNIKPSTTKNLELEDKCYQLIKVNAKRDLLSYLEDGVKKYQILATLDMETCEICGKMDGKIFNVREAEFGINFPPFCDRCRCTTVPYYDDDDTSGDTRAARDPVTGKTYKVPADMNYTEWHKTIVKKYKFKEENK